MEAMLQDLRFAVRQLVRAPLRSAFIILTLTIGIGAAALMFSVIDGIVLRPLYRNEEQLVRLNAAYPNRGDEWSVSLPNAIDWGRLTHSFSGTAWYQQVSQTLSDASSPERIDIAVTSPNLFSVLGVTPKLGRVYANENALPDGPRVILLGDGFWRSHFAADASVVGKTIDVGGRPAMVIGVMPPDFTFPNSRVDAYMPLRATPATWSRSSGGLSVIARLRAGETLASAQRDLDAVSRMLRELFPGDNKDQSASARPAREAMVGPDLRKALFLLCGAVALVLLIACVNVANMLLAHAIEREREIAIRAALGAGRARVVRQVLTEGFLLALLGGAGGLVVAAASVRTLPSLIPAATEIPHDFSIDGRVLLVSLVVTALTGIGFSLLPALRATSTDLNTLMGVRSTRSGAQHRTRRDLLVVVELALAVVLLASTGLALRGLRSLMQTNPGFRAEHLMTGRVPVDGPNRDTTLARLFYDRLLTNVRAIPGVESASLVDYSPMSGTNNFNDVIIDGRDAGQPLNVGTIMVAPRYLATMGIKLFAGRDLESGDVRAAPGVAMINRAFAQRVFGTADPIGKRIDFTWESGKAPYWRTIVGVYGDVLHAGLDTDMQPQRPEVAVPIAQLAWTIGDVQIVARTRADPQSMVPAVRRAVAETDPRAPLFEVKTMLQLIGETDGVLLGRVLAGVLAVFGGVALLLAALGLYGVIAYSVTQRTFEIGVRSALGADRRAILRMIAMQGARLAAAGTIFGIGGAYVAARLLRSLLHGVSPTDPIALAGTCAVLAGITAMATLVPALRASRIEPSVALRET